MKFSWAQSFISTIMAMLYIVIAFSEFIFGIFLDFTVM